MSSLIKILTVLFLYTTSVEVKSQYQIFEQDKTLEESIEEGQWIYEDFCMRCHLPSGKGVSGV